MRMLLCGLVGVALLGVSCGKQEDPAVQAAYDGMRQATNHPFVLSKTSEGNTLEGDIFLEQDSSHVIFYDVDKDGKFTSASDYGLLNGKGTVRFTYGDTFTIFSKPIPAGVVYEACLKHKTLNKDKILSWEEYQKYTRSEH
ncbi:MAG: hypothetical protein V1725_02475 [archaeon]